MNIKPFVLHESGSIPGVPGPNNGLWSGGQTVYVDMDTMEVVNISRIGSTDEVPAVQEQVQPVMEANTQGFPAYVEGL